MQLCCSISRTGFQLKSACPLLPVVEHTNLALPLGIPGLPYCPAVKGLTWATATSFQEPFPVDVFSTGCSLVNILDIIPSQELKTLSTQEPASDANCECVGDGAPALPRGGSLVPAQQFLCCTEVADSLISEEALRIYTGFFFFFFLS